MPFDWNTDRMKSVNIFVHEEVRIPKSLHAISDAKKFDAQVNGIPIKGSMLAIDPYSYENLLTLHYLLNKGNLISMSQNIPKGTEKMEFTLSPNTNGSNVEETQTDVATDTGGIHVAVDWSPSQLKSDTQSTLKLTFSDAFTGGTLGTDVKYSLRILDNQGKVVYSNSGLTAKGGTDTQTIKFPKDEKYNVEVKVDGLLRQGQTIDQSRNGVARGVVIVPEFPTSSASTVLLAVGAIIGIMMVVMRRHTTIISRQVVFNDRNKK